MPEFVHLHSHTQYSLLDGASEIGTMMRKAAADGQKGVALTDHGNMFGAFKFVAEAKKNNLKPIIGCEFYLVKDRHHKTFSRAKGEKDKRFHQLLLAKNRKGYENLCKLCSIGFIEGLYSKFPRIDKEILLQHTEGLVATSCCIGAEIPQAIMMGDLEKAEELVRWWLDVFGEDFYIELQRHRGLENIDDLGISQEDINQQLIIFARKYDIKIIATNDAHYVEEEDSAPHDILLCVNTGTILENEKRFKFPSSDFYFKKQAEMNALFHDIPEAIDYTMEIYDKVETLELARDVLLPAYQIPPQFKTQDEYLRHLTYEGAKVRYGTITPEIRERLDFELQVIANSGYPGYFLIVQDFTTEARNMGVAVGPGRGSAAGSVVAYCNGITNVDPIKYDLLFERFLNPERVSMPDIDIDFDDHGRQKVIDYVIDKYGRNQVAQIVTYGTMAAKSSLRDVGRVMDIPLSEVDAVAKTFPLHLSATLKKVLADGDVDPKLKGKMNSDDMEQARKFRNLAEGTDHIGHMIRTAKQLEGSIRNTGIHACGVVITPDEITKYVPVKTDKNSGMLVSQFDNSVAEDAGLLKMDFLGLKTLTIIKNACQMVKENHGVEIDPEEVPLDDPKTYELFQKGHTTGVFQYESPGMQKHMKALKPTQFEDLIAMNALYRPGPLEYIPSFIARKHGRETIVYDLDACEEYLKETYGITVYQEQVMLLSQKLAGFSKGQADMLRKAMGKKKKALLDELYPKFIGGGEEKGHAKETLDKIWKDWEAFASYAFNKSHSTCYAFVAFQTAYLKANYPAEFMSAVLTNSKSDIKTLTKYLRECKKMGIPVLGPCVNESKSDFSPNKNGDIRFGMSALKGVGEGPVEAIISEREKNGPFQSIFDMVRRLDLRTANKRCFESLAYGGGFDALGDEHRAQYFVPSEKYSSLIEHALKYGNAQQSQQATMATSLFGGTDDVMIPEPKIPDCEKWPLVEKLNKEREVAGIYISGHPLDDYRLEIKNFTTCSIGDMEKMKGQKVNVGGMVSAVRHGVSKKGTGWGRFTIMDFNDEVEIMLFNEDYLKHKDFLRQGEVVLIKGQYKQRWGRDEYSLTVDDVRQMEKVGEELTESILIKIPIDVLTAKMIENIQAICDECAGNHNVKFLLIDRINKQKLSLKAPNQKVLADSVFVTKLEEIGLDYKLNA